MMEVHRLIEYKTNHEEVLNAVSGIHAFIYKKIKFFQKSYVNSTLII